MSQNPNPSGINKGIKLPPTLVIIGIILLLASMAAEIIPKGRYEREEKKIPQQGSVVAEYTVAEGDTLAAVRTNAGVTADGKILLKEGGGAAKEPLVVGTILLVDVQKTTTRKVAVPGSYERLEREGGDGIFATTWRVLRNLFQAPIKGFVNKVEIIAFVLLIGGSFGIILATGAVDSGLRYAVSALEATRSGWLIIPILMTLFSLAGATFGMSEEIIPFVLITIPLALRLGYDSITGLCMCFVGAGLGFAAALTNPFTIGIAQGIAGVPPLSGLGFRLIVWFGATAIGIAYVMRWAAKVKRNPELSPTHEHDRHLAEKFSAIDHDPTAFGWREGLVLFFMMAAVFLAGYGATKWDWWFTEMTAAFITAGVLSGIVGRIGLEKAANAFSKGASELTGATLIIALSAAILMILEGAQVLDTILNWIDSSLSGTHSAVGACLMFIFHTFLNFFIPSGSGQAAVSMPIMAPLADLMGITRQTAVLAFQFGDGFGNMIIPTSAVTMSVLGLAEIPWEKWARWILPLQLILALYAFVMLTIAVMIGFQ